MKTRGLKLPDSEIKVMQYIWERGEVKAKETSEYMCKVYGWKKNTTYTVLNNLVLKQVIQRVEPGFLCIPLVLKEEVGRSEAESLLNKFYQGSMSALFSSFLADKKLSQEELEEMKSMIEHYDD